MNKKQTKIFLNNFKIEFVIFYSKKDTCFVDIPEDEIKLENTEIQGNFNKFKFSYRIKENYM